MAELFFDSVSLEYGPLYLLRRFFTIAESRLVRQGITLYVTDLSEAAQAQAENPDSWPLFPPMLDTRLSHIPSDTSFALLGKNADGKTLLAQCARFYNIPNRTLADIVADGSFCYGTEIPPKPGLPVVRVTAPSAHKVTGRFVYSGALWVHPSMRHGGLSVVLPRISRNYGWTRWDNDWTVGMVGIDVPPKNYVQFGYPIVEEEVTFDGLREERERRLLLVMDRGSMGLDLSKFVIRSEA